MEAENTHNVPSISVEADASERLFTLPDNSLLEEWLSSDDLGSSRREVLPACYSQYAIYVKYNDG